MKTRSNTLKLNDYLRHATLAILLPLTLFASLASAQTVIQSSGDDAQPETEKGHGNEGRWFQIEMIVFAQHPNQRDQETWPTNITLNYPADWKQLEDPELAEHDDKQALLESSGYYQLPADIRALNNNVRDLERSPGHRILFHEAWRQQVWGIDEAPSLLLQGGDQYGDHFELEGSIQISVARYLHLKTNLWFTEFRHNLGQATSEYPPLPAIPTHESDAGIQQTQTSDTPQWNEPQLISNEYATIIEQPYVSSRIITMQQKRRMRSKEIHYVDHPIVGILIYILPYELPGEDDNESDSEEPKDSETKPPSL